MEEFFRSYGTEIAVINHEEKSSQEELVEDLISLVSSFAGKLYGLSSHKQKEVVEGVRKLLTQPSSASISG